MDFLSHSIILCLEDEFHHCRPFSHHLSKYTGEDIVVLVLSFYAQMKMMMSQWLLFHTTAFFGSNIIISIFINSTHILAECGAWLFSPTKPGHKVLG